MALPDFNDLTGPLYVVTRPREHTREQWMAAFVSCLTGEHGEETREAARSIAARTGRRIPRDFRW